MQKRNKKWKGLAALLAVAVIGGSFAYFSQELKVDNELKTGNYGAELVEKFTPETLEPGAFVEKDVTVANTGNSDIVARVKWEEKWSLADGTTKELTSGIYAGNDETGSDVIKAYPSPSKWVYGGDDAWYYYTEIIAEDGRSDSFITGITLDADADMGTYHTRTYYTKADTEPTAVGSDEDTEWVLYTGSIPEGSTFNKTVYELDPDDVGYSDASYTLTIIVEVLQATSEAIANEWGYVEGVTPSNSDVNDFLKGIK